MRHGCAHFFYKPIIFYMGVVKLGVNTLCRIFCFFRALLHRQLWVGKGLHVYNTQKYYLGLHATTVLFIEMSLLQSVSERSIWVGMGGMGVGRRRDTYLIKGMHGN